MKKVWYGVAAVAIAASSFGFVSQTSFGQDVQQEIQAQVAALRAGQASSLNEDNTLAMGEDSESNRILASAVASQTANDIPVVKASDGVIVDAVVVPYRDANLSMATSGIVAEVLVTEGMYVEAGQPLIRLNDTRQRASVAQAEASVRNAQANLNSSQASYSSSQANLQNSQASLAELQAPPRQEEITRYQAAVTSAQANLQNVMQGPSEADLTAARADLANAEAELRKAQSDYDKVSWSNDIAMLPQATALEKATNNYASVKARVDDILAGADPDDVRNAQAQVTSAQADLNLLLAGTEPERIAGAQANVSASQASVSSAAASISASDANVATAQASLADAQAMLDETILRAPFAGTIAAINAEVGEQVSPGLGVVQLADLNTWRVETQDLTELNVVKIERGDAVDVTFDALPDVQLTGRVQNIKPLGENNLGDITYVVTVELDDQNERLRWNMTAETVITPDSSGRVTAQAMSLDAPARANSAQAPASQSTIATAASSVVSQRNFGESIQGTVVTQGANLNVRSGPGTGYGIVSRATNGSQLTITGRNANQTWLMVEQGAGVVGWVSSDYVGLNQSGLQALSTLPVSNQIMDTPPVSIPASAPAAPQAADYELILVPTPQPNQVQPPITQPPVSQPSASQPSASQPSASQPSASQPLSTEPVSLQTGSVQAIASTSVHSGLNGTMVFQSSNGGMIYAYDVASQNLTQLTHGLDPAISPDGQTVAFVRHGGENGLYLIDANGANERRIFAESQQMRAPSWSPDGEWVLFSRSTGAYECREIRAGTCVPDNPFLKDYDLISIGESGLSMVDINGNNFQDVPSLNTAVAPDWHEWGIVYESSTGIQVTNVTHDAQDFPVAAQARYDDPDWQPNGGQIAFQSREGNHSEIYVVNPDGSGLTALTRPQDLLASSYPHNVAPTWSPDGEHIAFLSNRNASGTEGTDDWSIWVMDDAGNIVQQLPIDVEIEYNFQREQVISWA